MPQYLLILAIIRGVVEIVKIIVQLGKDNPRAATECSVALKDVNQTGDATRLNQILDTLKKN